MNLLLRADAGIRMGTGHVMRCLALAQAWLDQGGQAAFASASLAPGLEELLRDQGCRTERFTVDPGTVEDAQQTAALACRLGATWVVVDGYQFSGDYQQRLQQAGQRVLAIDDHGHAEQYWAEFVLNQNLHADESLYQRRTAATRLLLGPRYALLRREFARTPRTGRAVPEVGTKVLVTLGGSDPDNVTGKVIEALHQVHVDGLEAIVVAGASNPHHAALERAVGQGRASIRLLRAVSDMPGLMAWADVAVAAGGTTAWERARMGLPSLVIILADNQRGIAEASERVGLGWNLGTHQELTIPAVTGAVERLLRDREARAGMAQCGPERVDGQGAARVVRELRGADVRLRPAGAEDSRRLWEWANDPTTRAVSFTTEPIPWEQHERWFASKLKDPACALFIALDGAGVPIGQFRCEYDGRIGVVSIGLDPHFRGEGYGTRVIRTGAEMLFARGNVDTLHAFIRPGNEASRKAFEKAGFRQVEERTLHGCTAGLFVLRRECR